MSYLTKTCKELIAICKEKNIADYSGKKKEQLIEMIKQRETTEVPVPIATNQVVLENTNRKLYEEFIVNHPNYNFLPKDTKQNWVCVSKKGENPRKPYWDSKQKELIDSGKIPKESKPVNVARYIHPTKKHVCGKCGIACSIYYDYPTANTWKWLKKTFDFSKDDTTKNMTIFEIYEKITKETKKVEFEKYFKVAMSELKSQSESDTYIGSKLSPGVMSNAPDRLDGFHCYNSVCGCRPQHDKGRSTENMKSYTRDRRAYEYFSDGNCLLANSVMGKLNSVVMNCVICGKTNPMTADHIGPISLGFRHDPTNFQACCNRCNSSKNNRITEEDVVKIKAIEEKGTSLVSWWAKDAWEKNKNKSNDILQNELNKNTKKFLTIIQWLKINKLSILETFITNNYIDINIDKSYSINNIAVSSKGDITFQHTESVSGKKTKETQKERTKQILLELDEKKNRKVKIDLSEKETSYLTDIVFDNFKSKIGRVLAGL